MTWSTRLIIKDCGSKILLIGDVIFCSSIFELILDISCEFVELFLDGLISTNEIVV
jgi:hypothetical protein